MARKPAHYLSLATLRKTLLWLQHCRKENDLYGSYLSKGQVIGLIGLLNNMIIPFDQVGQVIMELNQILEHVNNVEQLKCEVNPIEELIKNFEQYRNGGKR
jgi:hypothetical protein